MKILYKVYLRIKQLVIKKLNIFALLHQWRGYDDIAILNYHAICKPKIPFNDYCFITESDFEDQIKYLSENFTILSLNDALKVNKEKRVKPVAVITFDDGFYNNYSFAFPILKKYNAPATIFLATSYINTNKSIWFCTLIQLLINTKKNHLKWNEQTFDLLTNKQKSKSSAQLQQVLKKLPNEKILLSLNEISNLLECHLPESFEQDSPFFMLDQSAINEMKNSTLIDFGAHTHNHSILSRINSSQALDEIKSSIANVKNITGEVCTSFAYPNGRSTDFDDIHKKMLLEQNIKYAASTEYGHTKYSDDKLALKRLFISSLTDLSTFKLQVHGYK